MYRPSSSARKFAILNKPSKRFIFRVPLVKRPVVKRPAAKKARRRK